MPIMFNTLLKQEGISSEEVRLLRHQDTRPDTLRTPYQLWRDDIKAFELYQSTQSFSNRPKFAGANYWASFIATPAGSTMFIGIYSVRYVGIGNLDLPSPHREGVDPAGTYDLYDTALIEPLRDFAGRLFIEWGTGYLAWVQRADNQDKVIVELHASFKEPEFPGFLAFIKPLSDISTLPKTWIVPLRATRGIYLLTCPKTKEQYVGSASGEDGFWGRWQSYVQTGHGGNEGLKTRDPSDYQVSILEIAGSNLTPDEIRQLEQRWKQKLQSREMGLNRN
jgi:hypothetical protein